MLWYVTMSCTVVSQTLSRIISLRILWNAVFETRKTYLACWPSSLRALRDVSLAKNFSSTSWNQNNHFWALDCFVAPCKQRALCVLFEDTFFLKMLSEPCSSKQQFFWPTTVIFFCCAAWLHIIFIYLQQFDCFPWNAMFSLWIAG